jgi:glucuronoarabinoxylan endo-1,4-beta-xylanase
MMKLLLKTYNFLIVSLFVLCCASCKEEEEVRANPELSVVEGSVEESVSAEGGTFTFEVEWVNTQWNVRVGEVIEGNEFIGKITPMYGGIIGSEKTLTEVSVDFNRNESYSPNKQELILSSLEDDISHTIIITQEARIPDQTNVALNPDLTYQTISGFGGANMMWGTDYLTAEQIKKAFGTGEDELGLSIYRVRLSPNRDEWSALVPTIKEALQYGATILASPWSPPAYMKSNKDLVGGRLLEEYYADYAAYLNDFVQYMDSQGATIHAVSIQNEPDIQVGYESCDWTADEIYHFVKDHASAIQGARVVAAESFNFKHSYTDQILNDPSAAENLDIVGGHIYGGGIAPYPLAEEKGKEVWMTEYLMNQNAGAGLDNWNQEEAAIWEETMIMLSTIHRGMSYNWNAYIWWYIRRFYSFLGDGELGTRRGEVLRKGLAFSHYSKFVRPGYERIAVQTDDQEGLQITAYKGDHKIVVVAINQSNAPIRKLTLTSPQNIASAEAYTTAVNMEREKQSLEPDENKVVFELPARSIATFVMDL